MLGTRIVQSLSGALAAGAMLLSAIPAWAGNSVKFADNYEGYHLRAPYYIKGLGWHHPPTHRISRKYYFGYHHHPTMGPLVYPSEVVTRKAYVVRRPVSSEWCRARYRSYRAADNTFQPARGLRQQCCSPHH